MIRRQTARRRAGFTLVETIVTVGLLAVLAAFVVPTVVQKVDAADPVKVANDLNTVRGAIENFTTDTKGTFPRLVYALVSQPTITDSTIAGKVFTFDDIIAWNGPYLAATVQAGNTATLATGFAASISSRLVRYDAANDAAEGGGGTGTFNSASQLYVAMQVTNLTVAQAALLNKIIDGADEPFVPGVPNKAGRFRHSAPASGPVTAYYLAVPIIK